MKKKLAFTFAELLIAFTIIGIMSTFAIYTVQKYDKGIRYIYANAYHSLDRALFNAVNFSTKKSPFVTTELNENGAEVNVSAKEGTLRLCQMFAEYLNTSVTDCTSSQDSAFASTDGVNFGSLRVQTLNGVNIYISKRLPDNPSPGEHTFFIVYADINLDNRPNSMTYIAPSADNKYKTTDPDTFAFAALDIGRVCPLGIPEIEPRYMQARVAYTTQTKANFDDVVTKYSVVSLPYYQAKAEAWGYYLDGNADDDQFVIDDEPASYNGYIRSKLPANTKIYSFLNGATTLRVPQGVSLKSQAVGQGGYGCEKHSDDECWVIVDQYIY